MPDPGASGAIDLRKAVGLRRHRLVAMVDRALRLRCGPVGDAVVVGVSGGADSLALLTALDILRHTRRGGPRPIAVHVNHHLREEADADRDAVQRVCAVRGIALEIRSVHPAEMPGNLEANARELRYAALHDVAVSNQVRAVAVAHHADDQLETMLMALCRGAGLDGLAGMAWRRGMGRGVSLIRPMLGCTHAQATGLCGEAGLPWREDESNHDLMKRRAYVRHCVVPELEAQWPGAAQRAVQSGDVLMAAAAACEQVVMRVFGAADRLRWDRAKLRTLPVELIALGLRRAALFLEPRCADRLGQRALVQAAHGVASMDTTSRRYHWPHELTLNIRSQVVWIEQGE
jgi:tRNA(Ile)-lysidine synthetase-like protein